MSSETSELSCMMTQPRRDLSTGTSIPVADASGPVAAFTLQEAPLLHHQGYGTALGLEQVGRRLGHLLDQAVNIGAGQQRARQVAEALQLAIAAIGPGQGGAERLLLRLGQLAHMAKGHQGQERSH